MNIYFDTNVYRFIEARNELSSMRRMLKAYRCRLTASQGNLVETYAIPSREESRRQLEVIARLANNFEKVPQSWLHAIELRDALARLRPTWLKTVTYTKSIDRLLHDHIQMWADARCLKLPPPYAYQQYSVDAERGIAHERRFQKAFRAQDPRDQQGYSLVSMSESGEVNGVIPVAARDPEVFWRVDGLMVWYNAIALRHPSSRDYADWLLPYLKQGVFRDPSYPGFWLHEVTPEEVPLNRLTGLVYFYQTEHKVTHGNAADQLHAGHWLHSDLFLTADVTFHKVLTKVANAHYETKPKPVLVDRSAKSCLEQVEATVRSCVHIQ